MILKRNRFFILCFCLLMATCVNIMVPVSAQNDSCTISFLPYVQDFENVEQGQLPECWSMICSNYNNPQYWCPSVSESSPHSGIHSLIFRSGFTTYVVLPPLDDLLSIRTLELRLWVYNSTGEGSLSVGIISNGSYQTHPSNTIHFQDSGYHFYTFHFDWVSNDNAPQIAIAGSPNAFEYICVDDLELVWEPCSKISHLTVDNSIPGQVELNWHSNANGIPVGYDIFVSDLDHNVDYQSFTVDTFYTLTGLEQTTYYEVSVQTNCGLFQSTFLDTVTFWTHCFNPADLTVSYPQSLSDEGYGLMNFWRDDNYSQQLFLRSELDTIPRTITDIAFKYNNVETTRHARIYMANTSSTSLWDSYIQESDSVHFKLVCDRDILWKRDVDNEWFVIHLDSAFDYDGTHNLLLVIQDEGYTNSLQPFFVFHNVSLESSLSRMTSITIVSDPTHATGGSPGIVRTETRFIYCDENTCIRPEHLEVNSVGPRSASIEWILGDGNWDLAFLKEGDSTWTILNVSENPFLLENLQPNTTYWVKVRTNCNNDSVVSSWSELRSFTTDCIIETLPYRENFDNGTVMLDGSLFVDCWKRLTEIPGNNAYVTDESNHYYSSPNALTFPIGEYHKIAILPIIDDNITLSDLRLTYRWRINNTSTQYFETGVISDPEDITSFVPLDTVTFTFGQNGQIQGLHSCDFSNYHGDARYVAIRGFSVTPPYSSLISAMVNYVDDVELDYTWYCPRSEVTTVDSITSSSAQIGWDCDTSVHQWAIEYGPSGFQPGTGIRLDAFTNPFVITGLSPSTTYDIYVRSLCIDGDTGRYWSPRSFTTLQCDMDDRCNLTIIAGPWAFESSFGYSFNLGKVNVVTNGVVTQSYNILSSHTYSLELCNHKDVSLIWADSAHSQGQISLTVLNPDMDTLIHYFPNSTDDTICSLHTDCFHDNCPKPQINPNIIVTQHEADISWTAGGNESEWELQYRKTFTQEWVSFHTFSSHIHLDSLTPNTWYEIQLRALCSDSLKSLWCEEMFRTEPCSNSCDMTLFLKDSWGDGWNGASLDVMVNDTIVRNLTIEEGYEVPPLGLSLCLADIMKLVWHKGNYDNECTVCLTDASGDTLYILSGFSQIQNNQAFYTDDCVMIHHISATAGEGGSISPCGDLYVQSGENMVFSVIPEDGFVVNHVYLDGLPISLVDESFELSHIVNDHTIRAEFISNEVFSHNRLNLTLYPNPTSGYAVLYSGNWNNACKVQIYSLEGKTIQAIRGYLPIELDFTNYAPGVYVLEVLSDDGRYAFLRLIRQ